ncbi:hypothetical protein [Parasulfitobacter algicola]|uniref:Uncharacterized protein n=1 Tax=Parasulfitobacter algicola TaxID=2614809 RepID=A0ABX2IQ86_9RHOB|nr:hypothetical protein [Sulfitobacter algicola]NSX55049.1 hypothetical protein [Sulfitobacter algicola]
MSKRTWLTTALYWGIALILAWCLLISFHASTQEPYPAHWRFIIWWAVLLGTHLLRLPIVIVIYIAYFIDAFNGFMLMLYSAQPGADPFSLLLVFSPLILLGLFIWLWQSDQYDRLSRRKSQDGT